MRESVEGSGRAAAPSLSYPVGVGYAAAAASISGA
jgi:hypothetical protein